MATSCAWICHTDTPGRTCSETAVQLNPKTQLWAHTHTRRHTQLVRPHIALAFACGSGRWMCDSICSSTVLFESGGSVRFACSIVRVECVSSADAYLCRSVAREVATKRNADASDDNVCTGTRSAFSTHLSLPRRIHASGACLRLADPRAHVKPRERACKSYAPHFSPFVKRMHAYTHSRNVYTCIAAAKK